MQKIPHEAPVYQGSSFNCPFCNAFANQTWRQLGYQWGSHHLIDGLMSCSCAHCERYSFWHEEKMVYPNFSGVESPNQDLDSDIQKDYQEAADILQRSPRGAAALLRLSIQKLCIQLGEKGMNINTDIGNLVKKGLPVKVQESLDALRVIGNEAVHPGEMNLRDDVNIAESLFRLVNFIAEKMITEPREIQEIYGKIPDSKKEQIKRRDAESK